MKQLGVIWFAVAMILFGTTAWALGPQPPADTDQSGGKMTSEQQADRAERLKQHERRIHQILADRLARRKAERMKAAADSSATTASLAVKDVPVPMAVAMIEKQADVQIHVDPKIQDKRVSTVAEGEPILSILKNIAKENDWVAIQKDEKEFYLGLSDERAVDPSIRAYRKMRKLESNPKVTVATNDGRIDSLLAVIGTQCEGEVLSAGKAVGSRVSIIAEQQPLEEVLNTLETSTGLVWWVRGDGAIILSDPTYLEQNYLPDLYETRIYTPETMKAKELHKTIKELGIATLETSSVIESKNQLVVKELPPILEDIDELVERIDK